MLNAIRTSVLMKISREQDVTTRMANSGVGECRGIHVRCGLCTCKLIT